VAVTTSYDADGRLTSYARAGTSPQSMLYSGSDERIPNGTRAASARVGDRVDCVPPGAAETLGGQCFGC
jgi:hypothetical protein